MAYQSRFSTCLLAASLAAGVSYLFAVQAQMTGLEITAWKGMGVGLLAIYAAQRAKGRDGWILAGVLAFGAAGDVVLDIAFTAGAALFALGHILAIMLYRRHVRLNLSDTDRMIGALLIGVPVGMAWALTQKAEVALYTLLLGSMASAAWVSRFPTNLTALGAFLFVISDLLIFARMGPLSGSLIASLLVWTLYFGGQFLIVLGGTRYLAQQKGLSVSGG